MTTACQCWRDKLTDKKATYQFEEGNATMRGLLGGKGANLAEMKRLGIPVPDGFTITTEVCNAYYEVGKVMPSGLEDEIREQIAALAKKWIRASAMPRTPFWFPYAPAPNSPCPA